MVWSISTADTMQQLRRGIVDMLLIERENPLFFTVNSALFVATKQFYLFSSVNYQIVTFWDVFASKA